MSFSSRHYRDVAELYDRLARNGAYGTLAPDNRGGRKSEYVAAVFDAVLLPLVEHGQFTSLLDFGCGTGIFSRQAANLVRNVVGVDVSPGILEVARGMCKGVSNVKLVLTDGEHLPFDDNGFDCIVARETLCYVPDVRFDRMLAELTRVLKPGGQLLMIEQVSETSYWQSYAGTPHQTKRASSVIRRSAEQAGLLLQDQRVVRNPRFPGVYLAWSGLVPRRLIPALARFELAWHRHWGRPGRRWWDDLFLFQRPR
jgi:SAM-dependent methyltransferase